MSTPAIRALYAREDGDSIWQLVEVLTFLNWEHGTDFRRDTAWAIEYRELTINLDEDRLLELLKPIDIDGELQLPETT